MSQPINRCEMPADQGKPASRLDEISALSQELDALKMDVDEVESQAAMLLDSFEPQARTSALNLLHYLALRRHDLRKLQPRLAALGLSSLGRSEARILESLDAVRFALQALSHDPAASAGAVTNTSVGEELLADHTNALLGPASPNRSVRIMVTVPTEAANDYTLVH